MNISEKTYPLIFIIFCIVIVSIFFIPKLLLLYKTKTKIKIINGKINNYTKLKKKINIQFESLKNNSILLEKNKNEEFTKLKEIIKMNNYYNLGIEEKKSEYYKTLGSIDMMDKLIKIFDKNKIPSYNLINNLQNYFKNHTLKDYFRNISNILLTSTIINNESDIDFIYNFIIKNFYSDNKNNNKKYFLGSPCYKEIIDTNEPFVFHKKCDNVGHTIMLIKTNKTRFGGITDLSWGKKYYKENEYNKTKTRLFNLDNQKIFLYDKNQIYSKHMPPIRADYYFLAIFGSNDIYLSCLPWKSSSDFPQQFSNNNKDKRFNDLLNQNISPFYDDIEFEYEDIEVYPIISVNDSHNIDN